jgi:Domain of unknown function (DUF4172)
MPKYIHLDQNWPEFTWNHEAMVLPLVAVRHKQGRLLGKLEGLGFQLRSEASFGNLILDVMKSSEIEGERLPMDQVRSSIARKLGLEVAGLVHVARNVDGVCSMQRRNTSNPLPKTAFLRGMAHSFQQEEAECIPYK